MKLYVVPKLGEPGIAYLLCKAHLPGKAVGPDGTVVPIPELRFDPNDGWPMTCHTCLQHSIRYEQEIRRIISPDGVLAGTENQALKAGREH